MPQKTLITCNSTNYQFCPVRNLKKKINVGAYSQKPLPKFVYPLQLHQILRISAARSYVCWKDSTFIIYRHNWVQSYSTYYTSLGILSHFSSVCAYLWSLKIGMMMYSISVRGKKSTSLPFCKVCYQWQALVHMVMKLQFHQLQGI